MIRFVVTAAHRYTVDALDADFGAPLPACDTVTYEELFTGRDHPAATYIFCDIERLASRELPSPPRSSARWGRCRASGC